LRLPSTRRAFRRQTAGQILGAELPLPLSERFGVRGPTGTVCAGWPFTPTSPSRGEGVPSRCTKCDCSGKRVPPTAPNQRVLRADPINLTPPAPRRLLPGSRRGCGVYAAAAALLRATDCRGNRQNSVARDIRPGRWTKITPGQCPARLAGSPGRPARGRPARA
jgi:hypothetical protein